MIDDSPSPFVLEWLPRILGRNGSDRALGRARALDAAMGRGRHALALARAGAHVFGVDWRLEAVQDARARARAEGLDLLAWCADLTAAPLPASAFDIIVVTRYLDRGFFQSLRDAVRPGGTILYETFTVDQRQHGRGPTSSAHLLEHGELRQAFEGFDELFYEETSSPDSLARIAARRR